ncbi:extracellular catalytic domain type 1 short-chain-length polyhydroxyalkanoate depolymerase [Massilia niastensis]|uniref:extracellular catalytic domain type 1 short-chain-length polyhydroxyalkanoate depolymerase n=1 Tax=Massilia niastensis TaxID=544911 RepID=UPI00039C7F94|nr:PHB depolymerase family esterase [Massilia niastensis]
MKTLERFIEQMVESARMVRSHDTAGATAVIQKALKESGLLPGQGAAVAEEERAAFVDLNPAPTWTDRARLFKGKFGRMRGLADTEPGVPAEPANDVDDPAGGRFISGTYACEAGSRRYKLYVPKEVKQGQPLVVMLHGCTQNPDDFATGTTMNRLAEQHGCLVLYPEQPRSANQNSCWNWFEAAHQGRDQGEPAIIAGMTRDIIASHGADPKRVFVAGMSAGGAMAAILGAEYPDLYAAVGVHSGLPAGSAKDLISGLKAMKRPGKASALREGSPIIVFHGDSDHVVHSANGESVLQQFVDAHAKGGIRKQQRRHEACGRQCTTTTWTDGKGRPVAEHWLLHGAGHTWTGGNAAGSHTDAMGPCASGEMLRFFLGQQR